MDEDVGEGIGGNLDFLEYFSALPDPRQSKKVLYPLDEVLFVTLCAALCGADGWVIREEMTLAALSKTAWRATAACPLLHGAVARPEQFFEMPPELFLAF